MLSSNDSSELAISVIVRTYNSENFVEIAIKSAINQSLSKKYYEILVVDDGSTDSTLEVLEPYRPKIRIIKRSHVGPIKSLNYGITHSRGKYVILLDADDEFHPDILKEMCKILEGNEQVAYVYCDYYELCPSTGKKEYISLKDNIFKSIAAGIMYRKHVFKAVGLYNEKLIFPEYDLLMKLKKKDFKGKHLPKPLYSYIRRGGSLTSHSNLVEKGKKQLQEKYGKELPIRDY